MEEHLICIYLPYKSQPDKNDGKPSFIKTSRILYFARYIFYRDLMLERLKIIQYKELYRSVLSPYIYKVCLLTWKTCNYEFDFECTFINFPHTALYILKSTQNRCADNNKNTNGKILEKEIRKIFFG